MDSGLDKSCANNYPDFIRTTTEKWPSSTYIFTDGSLDPVQKKVGIGVYIPEKKYSLALRAQDNYSICSAEVMAIQIAIKKAIVLDLKDFIIFSDSKSALDRLSRNGLITDNDWITLSTRKSYLMAKAQNRRVLLVWIPSHTNILGNEKADLIAKTGRDLNRINLTKVDFRDILPSIKSKIHKDWMNEWANTAKIKGVHYANISEGIKKKTWFHDLNLSRKEITTYSRMRIGHCIIPAHLYKIGIRDSPNCDCGELGSLNHIIFECNLHSQNSNRLYTLLSQNNESPMSINTILANPTTDNVKNILKFLDTIHLKI